jgi:UDP-N-acetylmuramoylalanine-D-glutamate ligase
MSRSKLSWSDLPGARVGVWGLGREGHANLRKLRSLGVEPVLVDDHPGDPDVLATGDGGLAALERCDVVVKTPGLSRYRPEVERLSERGLPVVGGLGLWLAEQDLQKVLCVTGTKGKSTTASVTGHLLTGLGYRCLVAGNIGVVPYDPAENTDVDYWVIEVSSYQATDLPCTPPVTAVTSLHPDHLDWHGGVEQYYRDKLSMCTQPGADLTVANGDSDLLRQRETLLGPRVEWVSEDDDPDADWPPSACPGPATTKRCAPRRPATIHCPAGWRRSGRPPGSPSSTTACPPTCCPPWPRWTHSPAGGSRSSSAATTEASTTPRSPPACWPGTRRPWS